MIVTGACSEETWPSLRYFLKQSRWTEFNILKSISSKPIIDFIWDQQPQTEYACSPGKWSQLQPKSVVWYLLVQSHPFRKEHNVSILRRVQCPRVDTSWWTAHARLSYLLFSWASSVDMRYKQKGASVESLRKQFSEPKSSRETRWAGEAGGGEQPSAWWLMAPGSWLLVSS